MQGKTMACKPSVPRPRQELVSSDAGDSTRAPTVPAGHRLQACPGADAVLPAAGRSCVSGSGEAGARLSLLQKLCHLLPGKWLGRADRRPNGRFVLVHVRFRRRGHLVDTWVFPGQFPWLTPGVRLETASTQPLAEGSGAPWVQDTGLVYVWCPLWSQQLYKCFGYRIYNCSSPFCGRVGAERHLIRKTERGRVELGARWFWGQRTLLFPFTSHLRFLGCGFPPSSLV